MRYSVILCTPTQHPGQSLQDAVRFGNSFNTLDLVRKYIVVCDPEGSLAAYVFDQERLEYISPWGEEEIRKQSIEIDWVKEGF